MFGEVQTEKETLSTNKSIRPITKRQMDIWINKRCNEKDCFAKDITLYKADCLEVMPLLPESSIDLVLCDPPLELQLRNGIR